jgi:hypothetical protein
MFHLVFEQRSSDIQVRRSAVRRSCTRKKASSFVNFVNIGVEMVNGSHFIKRSNEVQMFEACEEVFILD